MSIDVLRALSEALIHAAQRSLRLRVEGRSSPHRKTAWLDSATDMALVGLQTAPMVLEFKEESAFGLVEETLRDALAGNAEIDLLDRQILASVSEFGKVLDSGLDAVVLNGNVAHGAAVKITREGLKTAERLRKDTPPRSG